MKLEKGKKYEHRDTSEIVRPVVDFVVMDENCKFGVIVILEDKHPDFPGCIIRTDIFGKVNGIQAIFEVSPYADWKIDDKVIVRGDSGKDRKRYFAGMLRGKPTYYGGGKTSWSADIGYLFALSSDETIKRVEDQQ